MSAGGTATASRRLRHDTRALHGHVESLVDVAAVTGDVAGYAAHLARTYAALAPVERTLAAHGVYESLGVPRADATSRLAADLRDLGRRTAPPASWRSPLEEAPGAVYVVEGAALGGRVLGRLVAAGLPGAPRRFLDVADDGRWRRVRAALDGLSPARYAPALRGARRTFLRFATAYARRVTPAPTAGRGART